MKMNKELAKVYIEFEDETKQSSKEVLELKSLRALTSELSKIKDDNNEGIVFSHDLEKIRDQYLKQLQVEIDNFEKKYPTGYLPKKAYENGIKEKTENYINYMASNKDNGIYDVFVEFRPAYDGSVKTFEKLLEKLKAENIDIQLLCHKEYNNGHSYKDYKGVYYVALRSNNYADFINNFNTLSDEGEKLSPSCELIGKRDIYFVPPMINKVFTIDELKDSVEKVALYLKDDYVRHYNFGLGEIEILGNRSDPNAIKSYIERAFMEMFDNTFMDSGYKCFFNCSYTYNSKDLKDKPVTVFNEISSFKKEEEKLNKNRKIK